MKPFRRRTAHQIPIKMMSLLLPSTSLRAIVEAVVTDASYRFAELVIKYQTKVKNRTATLSGAVAFLKASKANKLILGPDTHRQIPLL